MTAVLAARDVVVSHGRTVVLRGVSLEVEAGSVVAVLGPTGAGKTTLFRALVGERVADAGRVELNGSDVTSEPLWRRARRGLGYVPQGPSVLPDLTVQQNLETYLVLGRGTGGVAAWAERVGLGHRLGLRAGQLSGGERRLLELARALIPGPRVIVCDEPFSGIDPIGARKVAMLLRGEATGGVAVLLADHHADLALEFSDRAVLLVDGALRREGTPGELRADAEVCERYLGRAGG